MSGSSKVIENAICTFCGCVCDDIELTVDSGGKHITQAKNACVLGIRAQSRGFSGRVD